MSKPKVLVLLPMAYRKQAFSAEDETLLQSFAEVIYNPWNRNFTEEEIAERIRIVEGVICGWHIFLTRKHIELAQNLRIIGQVGGAVGNIDVVAVFSKGIIMTNASGGYIQAVAEFTLAMLICGVREIMSDYLAMREGLGNYSVVKGKELYGATVGLIGLGKVSSELVRLLRPFKVHILVCDPYAPQSRFHQLKVTKSDIETIFSQSDAVCILTQLYSETRGLISEKELRLMKDRALLVNTARGPIVDENALLRELRTGRIKAALDVFHQEPLPIDHELRSLPNVIITPHRAGMTPATVRRHGRIIVNDFLRFFSGKEPRNKLSMEQIEKMTSI